MTLERILLQTIKFDLQVEHPYSYLLKYAKCLKGESLSFLGGGWGAHSKWFRNLLRGKPVRLQFCRPDSLVLWISETTYFNNCGFLFCI